MSRLLYPMLLMLSLSQRQASVEAGSIPTPDEIELSILKITVADQHETLQRITERLKSIITIESELYDTRDLLAQTLIQLTSSVDPKEKEIPTDHIIRKRHGSGDGSGDGSGEDSGGYLYLNRYYLQALIPQLTARDGRDGINGKPGLPGSPGVDGTPGAPGLDGQNGQNGQDGTPGTPGSDGTAGSDGSDGSPGLKGAPGDSGTSIKGEQGSTGITGEPGPSGADGPGGYQGQKGDDGPSGSSGSPGTTGSIGETGDPGLAGGDGQKGRKGEKGESGESGADGQSAGAVYTHWGRTSCGGGSYLIYIGFTAGGYYDAVGGGVNFQCLPHSPQYNKFSGSGGSIITGVEYADGASVFPKISKHHDNVPCARCLTDRTALMMYPARRSCPSGWTTEYEGYLMSGHSDRDLPTTYVCMDGSPEFVSSSSSDLHGGLLNFVSPKCDKGDKGTISCPDYKKNKQLTCVVCSK